MGTKLKLIRRVGLAAVTIWKALPPERKKQTLQLARKHGPAIVKNVAKARRSGKSK